MRTAVSEYGFEIEYPNNIAFCFNPQKIKVSGQNLESITVNLFGINGFEDTREAFNGQVEIDTAFYLKLMFDIKPDGTFNSTFQEIEVEMTIKAGSITDSSFSFSMAVFFGSIEPGEIFNQSGKLRWWKNLPFTFAMYSTNANSDIILKTDGNPSQTIGQLSDKMTVITPAENAAAFAAAEKAIYSFGDLGTFSCTFSDTFDKAEIGTTVELEIDNCEKGVYLRWFDRRGYYRYWLFDRLSETVTCANRDDKMPVDFMTDNRFNGVFQQNKTEQKTLALQAALIETHYVELLKSILAAPLVDMYAGNGVFIPVQVAAGSFTPNRQHLQDFDLTLILPESQTQEV